LLQLIRLLDSEKIDFGIGTPIARFLSLSIKWTDKTFQTLFYSTVNMQHKKSQNLKCTCMYTKGGGGGDKQCITCIHNLPKEHSKFLTVLCTANEVVEFFI
jgi:hypothetical protein